MRTLTICNIDGMAYSLLLPWLRGLNSLPSEAHVACCCGPYAEHLRAEGLIVHDIPMKRCVNPLAHLAALASMARLLRSQRFDIVIVHSLVGATVGRVACVLTGTRPILCCVHGLFVTERTRFPMRLVVNTIEKALSWFTDAFLFVSREDMAAACCSGLVKKHQGIEWACVGVPPSSYCPDANIRRKTRATNGISKDSLVVGIVARIVREKGFYEFFEMARTVASRNGGVRFLVVGDTLPSDRDGISKEFRHWVEDAGLSSRFVFTGHTNSVRDYLGAMDIFVLPTYREGFPRSVLEAMAMELPVVTTNIRGCREAVVDGETGLLVPVQDSTALTDAVLRLVSDADGRVRMGRAGRVRVIAHFAEDVMAERFVAAVRATLAGYQSAPGGVRAVAE